MIVTDWMKKVLPYRVYFIKEEVLAAMSRPKPLKCSVTSVNNQIATCHIGRGITNKVNKKPYQISWFS